MKRVIAILLLLLVPFSALAQVRDPGDEKRAVDDPVAPPLSASAGTAAVSNARGQVPRPVPPPPPPDRIARRKGSMVGYVDNAIVNSKVRIRFDSGLHIDTPDRAEFFYAKCGCYSLLPASNPAFDPDAPGPRPGVVSDLNFRQIFLQGEYALTDRFSVHADLPLRWIEPRAFVPGTGEFTNQGGLGDIQAGIKYEVVSQPNSVATVDVQAFLPTGDASLGLGTNHASLQPALLWYQRISDRLVVESQVGDWLPIGGSEGLPGTSIDKFPGTVFFYGVGPSYEVYQRGTMRFAPVIELVGWHVLNGSQTAATADATGTNIVNLKIGGRVAWGSQGSLYVGWGHAVTSDRWYQNIVRIEYRHDF